MTNEEARRRLIAYQHCKYCEYICYDEKNNKLCPYYMDMETLDLDEAIEKSIEALEVLS